jgi:leucyl-tRNA synthetase
VAISDMMKLMNFADKQETINREDYYKFIKLVSPLIPHVADEILTRSDLLSGCVPASMRQVGPLEKGVDEVFAVKLE